MVALGLRVGGPRWRGPHVVKAFALARTLQFRASHVERDT